MNRTENAIKLIAFIHEIRKFYSNLNMERIKGVPPSNRSGTGSITTIVPLLSDNKDIRRSLKTNNLTMIHTVGNMELQYEKKNVSTFDK